MEQRVRARVLTDRYLEIRKRYRSGRPPPLGGLPGEERSNLLHGGDEMMPRDGTGGIDGARAPQWVRLLEDMNQVLEQIRTKLDRELRELHQKSSRPSFSADGTDADGEVEQLGKDISRMFVSLSKGMQRLKQLQKLAAGSQLPGAAEDARALSNVQSSLTLQIHEASQRYRDMQHNYVAKLADRRRRTEAHLTTSAEAQSWDKEQHDDGGEAAGGQAQLGEQVNSAAADTIAIIRQEIAEREVGVSEVSRQLAEVQTLFLDFDDALRLQGTMLDRIDTQLENTQEHIVKAVEQLKKAERHQKRSTFTILVLLLCVLIAIFAVCLIVKAA